MEPLIAGAGPNGAPHWKSRTKWSPSLEEQDQMKPLIGSAGPNGVSKLKTEKKDGLLAGET